MVIDKTSISIKNNRKRKKVQKFKLMFFLPRKTHQKFKNGNKKEKKL
jgi:hypothetical protein